MRSNAHSSSSPGALYLFRLSILLNGIAACFWLLVSLKKDQHTANICIIAGCVTFMTALLLMVVAHAMTLNVRGDEND